MFERIYGATEFIFPLNGDPLSLEIFLGDAFQGHQLIEYLIFKKIFRFLGRFGDFLTDLTRRISF